MSGVGQVAGVDGDVVGDVDFAEFEQDRAALSAGGEGDVVGADAAVGEADCFAERKIAGSVIAVAFVEERVDDQVEAGDGLSFVGTHVDRAAGTVAVEHADEGCTALVVRGRHDDRGIAGIDGWAAGEQSVRRSWSTVAGTAGQAWDRWCRRQPVADEVAVSVGTWASVRPSPCCRRSRLKLTSTVPGGDVVTSRSLASMVEWSRILGDDRMGNGRAYRHRKP